MSISMRRKQEVQKFKDSLGYLRPLSTPQQKQNNNNKTEIRMSKKYLCVHIYMFIFLAVLLTITKRKMIQMSISVWKDKSYDIGINSNIMKHIFALVRNKILIHAMTETNILAMMLSDKPVSSSRMSHTYEKWNAQRLGWRLGEDGTHKLTKHSLLKKETQGGK